MKYLSLICVFIIAVLFAGCRNQDVFGDYSIKYSYYNSDSEIKDNKKDESSELKNTESEEPKPSKSVEVVKFTDTLNPGDTATLSIKAEPEKLYSIKVYYKSGASKAAALSDKYSNNNGLVTWTWKIGVNTSAGSYSVNVIDTKENKIIFQTVLNIQ